MAGYLTLFASGLAIALFSIANLSMSLPEDEQGPGVSRATLVRRRLHSRYTHLELRLHSLVSLRRELQASATEQQQKQAAASAAAAAAAAVLRPRSNHTSNGSAAKTRNAGTHAVTSAAATAAAAATTSSSSANAAARRARRGVRRPAPVAASPPPSMGPPLLLRPGREAACLAHSSPLEALARATCSFSEARQQFVWEARS